MALFRCESHDSPAHRSPISPLVSLWPRRRGCDFRARAEAARRGCRHCCDFSSMSKTGRGGTDALAPQASTLLLSVCYSSEIVHPPPVGLPDYGPHRVLSRVVGLLACSLSLCSQVTFPRRRTGNTARANFTHPSTFGKVKNWVKRSFHLLLEE